MFGYSLMRLDLTKNIRLLNEEQFDRACEKEKMRHFSIVADNLMMAEFEKERKTASGLEHIGYLVLEYARNFMFNSIYAMLDRFGEQMQIYYSDTDNIIVSIDVYPDAEGNRGDLYQVLQNRIGHMLDFSNLPSDHRHFSNQNRLIPGLFKNEFGARLPIKGIFLKSKCYCVLFADEVEVTKNKGISRRAVQRQLQYLNFQSILNGSDKLLYTHFFRIGADKTLQIYTYRVNKVSLQGFDSKMFYTSAVESRPHFF